MAKPILIVDSNREFGILIRQSLEESEEYRATLAHSGQAAIEAASNQQFEVALIDFGLPDIPGAEVVRSLRDLNPGISIVAIPIDGRAEELENLNIAGVLMKPFYLPDLPRIIDKALKSQSFKSNWIQWEQHEKPKPPTLTQEPASPEPSPPPTPEQPASDRPEDSSLSKDRLESGVDRVEALAALIWDGERPVAEIGLTRDQLDELRSTLGSLSEQLQRKRAVTYYVQLPDQEGDSLLYATPWRGDLSLVVLYPAATSFRKVRRGVQKLAKLLETESIVSQPAKPELTSEKSTRPTPASEGDELPEDWVPESEFSPAQRAVLEELASIEPPPPDPEPSPPRSKPDPTPTTPELPDDWIPTNRRPEAVLAMIDEPDQPSASEPHINDRAQPGAEQLEYSLVLVPRFPEHKLTGSLAEKLADWVKRICLAWDWDSHNIQVDESFLHLRLTLNADSAPSQAVQQLKADLARHILNERTEWNAVLPSGRFFARRHLLTAGDTPNRGQIRTFIDQLRMSQGLSS